MNQSTDIQTTIRRLCKEKNAVLLAHTYQPGIIQDSADFVGDSYGLSVQATRVTTDIILFCGVRFMAETAALLNPNRTVILPETNAGCPMADMIEADDLRELQKHHPDATTVCYVNSPVTVKAYSDICCTSSNAVKIISQIPAERTVIFVPDKHLGSYVEEQTGRSMILWNGFCPTHDLITPTMVEESLRLHPGALVMMHPEAPPESRALAHQILSTGQMCDFVRERDNEEFIVATETGLIHTLQTRNPEKHFYPLHTPVVCPNMKRITPTSIINALEGRGGEKIVIPEDIAVRARKSIRKMLDMSR